MDQLCTRKRVSLKREREIGVKQDINENVKERAFDGFMNDKQKLKEGKINRNCPHRKDLPSPLKFKKPGKSSR